MSLKKFLGVIALAASSFCASAMDFDTDGSMAWDWRSEQSFASLYRSEIDALPCLRGVGWVRTLDLGVMRRELKLSERRWFYIEACKEKDCALDNMSLLYQPESKRLYGIIYKKDGGGQHYVYVGKPRGGFRKELLELHLKNFQINVDKQAGLALFYIFGLKNVSHVGRKF